MVAVVEQRGLNPCKTLVGSGNLRSGEGFWGGKRRERERERWRRSCVLLAVDAATLMAAVVESGDGEDDERGLMVGIGIG